MGFNQKINDAMNNMSRAVTVQMMEDAPADLKYVYIGAIDEKTRPFCLEAAAQGALTKDEILALGGEYAESLVSGGGINCRHNWELASDDIQSQFHRGSQAQKILDGKIEKGIQISKKPTIPKKEATGGFLDLLIGDEAKEIMGKTVIEANKMKERVNAKINELKKEANILLSDRKDWRNRKYKKNTKKIAIGGRDEFDTVGEFSTSALNERRRWRTIQNFDEQIQNVYIWIEYYEDRLKHYNDSDWAIILDQLDGITAGKKVGSTDRGFRLPNISVIKETTPKFKKYNKYTPSLPDKFKEELKYVQTGIRKLK